MNSKEKESVFIDLYELYREGELEEETMIWMKQYELAFQHKAERRERQLKEEFSKTPRDLERDQIRHVKMYVYSLYVLFILLSIWMTVWFYF
ncbi:hypothetical protein [Bacillus atrophaeus]|uniref:hypothetical protein n=1 Tax=Bacillus atrophaeus TaxID=1452 RepID=UPI002283009C|nr:hypothetical protein [Bacillus atrophaeus]MCY8823971.1 hypothetical protein [Bacillus atrophaeus]MCY8958780.1 hypothetical protein [Bacillus atrophaeus]MCY8964355.1 hypothetical protein [Bacillus atrophaeus]MCY9134156.1 hypothetical protein [Bacillus atrophaeus]MCY9436905.1 hypothetical protein [Bacillus atrophaeus]